MTISRVAFQITDRCQLDCDHCLRDPGLKARDLPLSLIDRVVEQAVSIFAIQEASFTGGEPTLHPQFVEIVDAVIGHGVQWSAVVNGERLGKVFSKLQSQPDRLASCRNIALSIDGATPEMHDAIRGKGSFDAVMRATATCVATGVPFSLQMTVNGRNEHEIEALGLLAATLGASAVSFNAIVPTGTFLDAGLKMPFPRWLQVRERIERLSRTLRIRVLATDAFFGARPYTTCGPWTGEPLYVDVFGQLVLCCMHSGVPGDDLPEARAAIGGDLHTKSLLDAQLELMRHIAALARTRVQEAAAGELDRWDSSPCNWCMKRHGRPHWTSADAGGATAERARWRGTRAREPESSSPAGPTRRCGS